jgi:hypothetical protein
LETPHKYRVEIASPCADIKDMENTYPNVNEATELLNLFRATAEVPDLCEIEYKQWLTGDVVDMPTHLVRRTAVLLGWQTWERMREIYPEVQKRNGRIVFAAYGANGVNIHIVYEVQTTL